MPLPLLLLIIGLAVGIFFSFALGVFICVVAVIWLVWSHAGTRAPPA